MATRTTKPAPEPEPQPEPEPELPEIGDAFADLLAGTARPVVNFRARNEGDGIVGKVITNETRASDFGEAPCSILDVDPDDPTKPFVAFVWFGTVRMNAFVRNDVRAGDIVAATLQKKHERSEAGDVAVGQYDDWRIIVRKDPRNPSPVIGANRAGARAAGRLTAKRLAAAEAADQAPLPDAPPEGEPF